MDLRVCDPPAMGSDKEAIGRNRRGSPAVSILRTRAMQALPAKIGHRVFQEWLKLSREIAAANMAAQRVIALRCAKLAKGGPAAQREARRMIVEKVAASVEAAAALASGRSAHSVVRRYKTIVRANERRLRRKT